jgi:LysR family transcriptional activator of nhaA
MPTTSPEPLLVPGRDHGLRASFDLRCEQLGIRPRIRAEVDDMALLRLLARDTDAVALVPTVVVQDELASGRLVQLAVIPELHENFYAVTVKRRFQPALIDELLSRPESGMLTQAGAAGGEPQPASGRGKRTSTRL